MVIMPDVQLSPTWQLDFDLRFKYNLIYSSVCGTVHWRTWVLTPSHKKMILFWRFVSNLQRQMLNRLLWIYAVQTVRMWTLKSIHYSVSPCKLLTKTWKQVTGQKAVGKIFNNHTVGFRVLAHSGDSSPHFYSLCSASSSSSSWPRISNTELTVTLREWH